MTDHAQSFLDIGMTQPSQSSQTLGFKLIEMDIKAGTAKVSFEGKPEFANPTGYIQGGFLSAMLDDVMGMMAMLKVAPKAFASTVDLHVHYLRPVRVGQIIVEARITNKGPTIMFAEADLFDCRGKISAKATSALAITALRIKSA
ncbi:MAG: PaaI family thioesterase [Hyphomonadaceae bacterium]|nr:PaaI family thioesterase [Hyphomonadaceae bacterium]